MNRLFVIFALAALLAGACMATPTAERVVETVVMTVEISRTPAPPAATPTPPEATAAPEATPTKTLVPLQQTLAALRQQAGTPTPLAGGSGNIADDDYAGIFEMAWQIVNDEYVRGNFNEVDWQAVHDEYLPLFQAVQSQEEHWDLLDALIAELHDNHSRFVRPGDFSAEFGLPSEEAGRPWPGFRLGMAREYEYLTVWNVCTNGPAAQAGLERGDRILAIDGQEFVRGDDGWEADPIYAALYDENQVTLTVQQGPGEEPEDITIEFGGASGCDGWVYGVLSEQPYVGYIRIPAFDGNAAANIEEAIGLLEEDQPLEGLVLDVRHNPGGNADQATAIFTQGVFGYTGKLREGATQTIFRIRGPVRWSETVPLALLTDGSSHSAAEYFATALQQSGRATLVGAPTAGNTEGIISFNLPDGSVIRLAVQTLVLPDGSTLEGVGVIPDLSVDVNDFGLQPRPDEPMRAALEAVIEKIESQ